MPNPAWFNEEYFAGQKIAQMTALGQTIPDGATAVEQVNAAIAQWNASHADQSVADLFDNFEACNTEGYITSVVNRNQINVSPNELFDVTYYLTALAKNANDTGYAGAPEGGWTAQSVLQNMYQGGYSAWTHFMGDGLDRMIDCSSSFNTKAYLDDKAAATEQTVDQVIAQMKADGLNPVMDYYLNGQALGITAKPVTTPLDVTMSDAAVWVDGGGDVPPAPETDPYDEIASHVEIKAGDNGPYEGEDGVNTQFEAVYSKLAGTTTLADTDVITGGADAFNTLAVSLGDNWGGFKGIATGVMGQADPNVTNVGRVVINREQSSSEASFTFSAKNISEDTERFDINAKGTGNTNLADLSDGVKEVNINGLRPMDAGAGSGSTQATSLNFVSTANAGANDTLTIGLNNTGSAKAPAPVTWNTTIETVIINSKGEAANGIDLRAATGVKELDVKGTAELTAQVQGNSTLKTIDMHEATGKVTLNAYGLSSQKIIGGQHEEDTVALQSGGTVNAKGWSAVENVTFAGDSGTTTTFNAKGAEGIKAFWVADAGAYTVNNLTADDITVYQTTDAGALTTINGTLTKGDSTLGNITWQSASGKSEANEVKANFSSNADGTAAIKLMGQDALEDGSSFTFSNATKLVIESENPTKAKVSNGALTTGVTLVAPDVTDMDVTLTGPMKFVKGTSTADAALGSVQTLNVTLQDVQADGTATDVFSMADYNLGAAQTVNVDAGGEIVYLGKLGTPGKGNDATPRLDLNVENVENFAVGDMGVGLGGNIQAVIDSETLVQIGKVEASTNALNNVLGDVYLEASGTQVKRSAAANATGFEVKGGDLTLDFSGVTGDATTGNAVGESAGNWLQLNAQGGIDYTGASGKDFISVTGLGATVSDIDTGAGADSVQFDLTAMNSFKSASSKANVSVNLADGEVDQFSLTGTYNVSAPKGFTIVRVTADAGDVASAVLSGGMTDLTQANAVLKAAGLDVTLTGTLTATGLSDAVNGHQYFVVSSYTGAGSAEDGFIVEWTTAEA